MPSAPRLAEADRSLLREPVRDPAPLGDRGQQLELAIAADVAALPPECRPVLLERLGFGHGKERPLAIAEAHLLVVALGRKVGHVRPGDVAAGLLIRLPGLSLLSIHRGLIGLGYSRARIADGLVVGRRRFAHDGPRVDDGRGCRHQLRPGGERDRIGRDRERRQPERPARFLPCPEAGLPFLLDPLGGGEIVLHQIPHDIMVEADPDVPELRREPVVELVLHRPHDGLDGMLHQPGPGLDILRPGQAGIIRGAGDPDHPRVDPEGRADVFPADSAEVRELEVAEREAERLDVADRPKEGRRPALAAVDHAGPVPILHGRGVILRGLVREQDGERRRAVIGHDLPDVGRGLVVGRHGGDRRGPSREAEDVREEGPRHIEVPEVQHVLRRHGHNDARPVAVVVSPRVALAVHPDGLEALGIDRPERDRRPGWPGPLHLEHGVAVAHVVHSQPGPHGASRHPRAGVVEQPLQRMRLGHPALRVAPLGQHHERDRGDNVGHGPDAGMDHGML